MNAPVSIRPKVKLFGVEYNLTEHCNLSCYQCDHASPLMPKKFASLADFERECILAELKLLTTDLGRMAMSAAAVNDVAAWILLALAIALSGDGSPIISLWVLLTAAGFVIAISLFLRPVLAWMARR